MMYGYYGNMFGGSFMMIIFWVAVIGLIIWLFKKSKNGGDGVTRSGDSHQNKALDILKERYAKGEINKQEFEDKKKDLSN